MNRLNRAVAQIGRLLDELGLKWALAGGLAVSARTSPRFTRDADIVVAVLDDGQAEEAVHKLRLQGYGVLATVEQEAVQRLATVRLTPPGEAEGGMVIDLLFASSGIEPEIVAAAEPVEVLPGLTVPLPQVGHLIAVKVLSRDDAKRPQDLADLRALLDEADADEIDRASRALSLITERGYNRGRRLDEALQALVRETPPPRSS